MIQFPFHILRAGGAPAVDVMLCKRDEDLLQGCLGNGVFLDAQGLSAALHLQQCQPSEHQAAPGLVAGFPSHAAKKVPPHK